MGNDLVDQIIENVTVPRLRQIFRKYNILFQEKDIKSVADSSEFLHAMPSSTLENVYKSAVVIPKIFEMHALNNLERSLKLLNKIPAKMEIHNMVVASKVLEPLNLDDLKKVLRIIPFSFFMMLDPHFLSVLQKIASMIRIQGKNTDFQDLNTAISWFASLDEVNYRSITKELFINIIIDQGTKFNDPRRYSSTLSRISNKQIYFSSLDEARERLHEISFNDLNIIVSTVQRLISHTQKEAARGCVYAVGCIITFLGFIAIAFMLLSSLSWVTFLVIVWVITSLGFGLSIKGCSVTGLDLDAATMDQEIATKIRSRKSISCGFMIMIFCAEFMMIVSLSKDINQSSSISSILSFIGPVGGVLVFVSLFGFAFATISLMAWNGKAESSAREGSLFTSRN